MAHLRQYAIVYREARLGSSRTRHLHFTWRFKSCDRGDHITVVTYPPDADESLSTTEPARSLLVGYSANPLLKVLVADTQPLFAECLATALGMQGDLDVLEDRPVTGPGAVSAAVLSRPDILVLDYWMPEMGGPAATAVVGARTPTSVVLLSWLFGPREVRTSLAAGAAAFIPKTLGVKDLVDALRRVGSGEKPVFPAEFEPLLSLSSETDGTEFWRRLASLTDREIQILRLLGMGQSKSTIASTLSMSPETARTHIEHIRQKLDARTQVAAVAIARQYGFVPP